MTMLKIIYMHKETSSILSILVSVAAIVIGVAATVQWAPASAAGERFTTLGNLLATTATFVAMILLAAACLKYLKAK